MKRLAMLAAMMGIAGSLNAQNLVENSTFDTDVSGWDLSTYSTWSDRVDHNNSPYSGALQVTTRDKDFAAQCVELRGSTTYAVSIWVEKDTQASIAPCASPNHGLDIELRNTSQCGGETTLFLSTLRQIPEPNGWQHILGEIKTQTTTRSALVTLSGECDAAGTGISIHYFDDIVIAPDTILQADFELHAPETGPGQPPTP
jgi:Carbohydrate binding domain